MDKDFVQPNMSTLGAPILFIEKKYDIMKMCIDYHQLNEITIHNKYHLPHIENLFN